MGTTMIHGPLAISHRLTRNVVYSDDIGKGVVLGLTLYRPKRVFIFYPENPTNGVLEYWPNKDISDWPSPDYVFSSTEIFSLLEQGLDVTLCDEQGTAEVELSLPRPEIWVYTITLAHPTVDLPYEIIDGDHLALVRVSKWTWIVTTKIDLSEALKNYKYWRRPLL